MNSKAIGAYQTYDVIGAVFMSGEAATLPANWAYPDNPGMQPTLDLGDITHNTQSGHGRGSSNWAYPIEPGMEPAFDLGDITHNTESGLARGWNDEPFNAQARGLGTRGDPKIKRPWVWP